MKIANLIVFPILILIVTLCSIFWLVYFYKKSKKMYKMHLEMKELYKHDKDSEWYFLIAMYRNQYFKTIFIITSTLLEAYSIISLLFHEIIPKSDIILENVDNFEIKLNICTEENIMEYEELSHFSWFNLTQLLIESSNVCTILSSVVGVALMRLIITELKFENPWERTRKGTVTNFALCLSLTTTVLIFTIISYTWLIAMLMGGIISLIYYVLFVREIRRVQAALAQYSRERLVQFGENRKELVQLRRFKILSNTLCLGVTFFVFSLIYEKINIITSLILYYGQCYAYLTYHKKPSEKPAIGV